MNVFKQLLADLEAERDMAFMNAKEAQVKAVTIDHAVIKLRNAIQEEEKERRSKLEARVKEQAK